MDDKKRCTKCDNEEELFDLNFRKAIQKNRTHCCGCVRLINKENRTMNREEIKIRRKEDCEKIKNKYSERIYDI